MLNFALIALVAAVVTFFGCAVVLRFARKKQLFAAVRERDVHKHATPRLGGVAMYGGIIAAFTVAYFVPGLRDAIHSENTVITTLLAITIIAFTGIVDDLRDITWSVKLIAQLLAAVVLSWQGVHIFSLPIGNTLFVTSPTVSMLLTVVLLVGVMNALNFIDGLDGLAAGFTLIASGFFFVYTQILAAQTGQSSAITFAALIATVLFGICLGFLPWNWHVAKLFMGDTGALLLGIMLATSTITVTGQLNPATLDQKLVFAGYIPIILPIILLAFPFADMILAVFRRLLAGKSPFSPDRKHLHHRLLDYGHSVVQVVFIYYFWTAIAATSCLLVFLLQSYWIPLMVFVSGAFICLLVTLVPAAKARDVLQRRGLWVYHKK
ncbi:MraY family glycosyltransferase [Canibacter oris]|uniref:UDP-GlcNAc:undecaprenyl-phosphate GlcNAc-1-phosphate transferase n=1 Tax=Canibacter oris TaxID=1365628 RepID=A0A840DGG0_9MICO|nr:MraY family glycosyltransferase [Canibacter oris]MBB4072134.1 UDP-GlcNAc:undecaprenyl-phosphate GlcNAc-1-phosphate transferase [Canibacter oris]